VKLHARRAGPFGRAHGPEYTEGLHGKVFFFDRVPLPAGRQAVDRKGRVPVSLCRISNPVQQMMTPGGS